MKKLLLFMTRLLVLAGIASAQAPSTVRGRVDLGRV